MTTSGLRRISTAFSCFAPASRGKGLDALLVGVYEKKELIFTAKVKDGFVPEFGTSSSRLLRSGELRTAPSQICPRKGPRGGVSR